MDETADAPSGIGLDQEVLFAPILTKLERLGLVPSEARVLMALLLRRSATSPQLASAAGMERSNVYRVLESLKGRGLADRLPGGGPAVWIPAAEHEVLIDRLVASYMERLNQLNETASAVKDALDIHLPLGRSLDSASVQVIKGPVQTKQAYDRLLDGAKTEVAMSGWPPYRDTPNGHNHAMTGLLVRKVSARLLYQEDFVEAQGRVLDEGILRHQLEGMQIRVTESNIVKSVIVDGTSCLVGLGAGTGLESGSITSLLIESAEYGSSQKKAFDDFWESAMEASFHRIEDPDPSLGRRN